MPARELVINYTPVTRDDGGEEQPLPDYDAQLRLANDLIADPLRRKLDRLAEYAESQLTTPEIEIDGLTTRGAPRLWYFQVLPNPVGSRFGIRRFHVTYHVSPNDRKAAERDLNLTDATRRLIENVYPMCEQLAWSDLRARLGHPAPPATNRKRKVLLSYRKGNEERQSFVEAVAHRLGREGFRPWFDAWEIKAGDSIARELDSGFHDVYAIIIVLSADYPGGRWAREEMETARSSTRNASVPTIRRSVSNVSSPTSSTH